MSVCGSTNIELLWQLETIIKPQALIDPWLNPTNIHAHKLNFIEIEWNWLEPIKSNAISLRPPQIPKKSESLLNLEPIACRMQDVATVWVIVLLRTINISHVVFAFTLSGPLANFILDVGTSRSPLHKLCLNMVPCARFHLRFTKHVLHFTLRTPCPGEI